MGVTQVMIPRLVVTQVMLPRLVVTQVMIPGRALAPRRGHGAGGRGYGRLVQ